MKKKRKPKVESTIIRINKGQIERLVAKRYYYCVDNSDKENVRVYFVDNTKGKKDTTEFNSIDELLKYLDN